MSNDITPVVFRRWRDTKTIFALFPTLPSDYEGFYCDSYEHIGQHSGADYFGCVYASKPVSLDDAADLKRELERIGYRLRVIRRASGKHHEARRATARSYR